jgi:hypothetical protein
MSERTFERQRGELRCRRYLFDVVEPVDHAPRPEGAPPERAGSPPERLTDEHAERPQ